METVIEREAPEERDPGQETWNGERAFYTKEELDEKVIVPTVVEQDLKRIISDRLEQCGLYFRVFSRIKTAASMEKKFSRKEYGEDHKLQDLQHLHNYYDKIQYNLNYH